MAYAAAAKGGTLTPPVVAAQASDRTAMREAVRSLQDTFRECFAKYAFDICMLLEAELEPSGSGSGDGAHLVMLVNALEWQALELMEVRFCRCRFSPPGDLGYRGLRGAVG
jgi:hypothetical protein